MSTLRERIDAELENLESSMILLPDDVIDDLKQYMAFRHYFAHAYVMDVDPDRLEPLVGKLPGLFEKTKIALSDI